MKIAIPVWNDKVSPVFDTALKLLVVNIDNGREESRFFYPIDETDITQKCQRIKKLELDTLICGAVSQTFLQILLSSGLEVIQEISGPAEDVLKAYIDGNIFQPRFLMPGCRRWQHRCCAKEIMGSGCRAQGKRPEKRH
jgi:predicted Fe-Mo cluster-binding NifX family protein